MAFLVAPLLSFLALIAPAQASTPAAEPTPIVIEVTALGDSEQGVASRIAFRFTSVGSQDGARELVVQGSILQGGIVLRNFRYQLRPEERGAFSFINVLPLGEVEVEARLLDLPEGSTPVMLAKQALKKTIVAVGTPYIAAAGDGAEGALAEGAIPEVSGAVRILPPKRDLAPNLFIVDVEVKAPVKRVEFWVEGKKIFTKNAAPYRMELDLGKLPRRVEVRAIGYDAAGRYVDADAWMVNERENPLELKITRTVTPDQVSHLKVSVQNAKQSVLGPVELFIDDRRIMTWQRPPYAIDLARAQLANAKFIRASVKDSDNLEASDLLFLDGSTFMEEIEVNLVELPVSVTDERGNPIVDMKQEEFSIFEDGKRKKISNFAFSQSLPLSIGLLIDHSGSMKKRIEPARQAALAFFKDILRPDDRAFFGGFSWQTQIVSPFVSDLGTLNSQVSSMPEPDGATALYDAIVSGLYRFRSVQGRKALVIVSDGEDTASRIEYNAMLNYARASRVPLYFIGVDIGIGGGGKMRALADETGGRAYFIRKVEDLEKTYEQLEAELRTQYLLRYYTETTKKDQKYRTVDVKTTRKGMRVRTVRGFIP